MFSFPKSQSNKQRVGKLYGSALPLSLAKYCEQTKGIKLIITKDNLTAGQMMTELEFFLENSPTKPEILLFPDWETLPYDQFSPHQDIISERLYVLSRLSQAKNAIVITATSTLMHRICPHDFLKQNSLILKCGQTLNIENFRDDLQKAGYYHVNTVLEHGEFSKRGSILDLYPMGSELPFRIELFDDEIESLRSFDPDTQRTVSKLQDITILPAREFPLNQKSISLFRQSFRDKFSVNPTQCSIYEAVSNNQFTNGIEYYLPLFFEKTATIFDYLPKDASVCRIENTHEYADKFWDELVQRYDQLQGNISRPILKPDECFVKADELLESANQFTQVSFYHNSILEKSNNHNFNTEEPPSLPVDRKSQAPLHNLSKYISESSNRFLIIAESIGRQEMLLEMLRQSNISAKQQTSWQSFIHDDSKTNICVGALMYGAEIPEQSISIINESQLFGEQITSSRKKSSSKTVNPDVIIKDLAELSIGAPVVHIQFGVGRYQGLQTFDSDTNEFLILTYANEDKIYVPVTSLHLISRYTGADSDHAPLHRLGSDQWQKEKNKAFEKVNDVAIELLEIYAKREASKGFKYDFHAIDYQRFASGFIFSETPDQTDAINEIIKDMQSTKPMDRLICGDVGFGKTEVAMRAAYLAAQNGKQVCILAPTTLLAGQHFETFRERFVDFPITVDLLSRFRSAKESTKIVKSLANGQIDIIIGTHKLFQKNIEFKNLGLLIIDEEHRFGVKQKEHMKTLRAQVDVLCMTATPIPRTLNMSMAGIRDISLIASPPAKRLAIKTFWQERNNGTIREAILREILRGGQVFFLHNNVQTIEKTCLDIQELVPEANIRNAHGQMKETDLERIMSDFYHNRFNVLVCTTIIETGIDIPTANTIIIDRADKFGLAQLHQLRGRVGRSHHQAYAYLMTPNEKLLTSDSKKRLEAIVSFENLGAGFTLATMDMEIRGAGELLGDGQSGNMHAIGFSLYMEMLDKAVNDLKSGKTPELAYPMNNGPEIDLRMPAIIPDDYISDVHVRLIMYKRIANATDKSQLKDLQVELIDRYGLLPIQLKLLCKLTELKFLAAKMGINKIYASTDKGSIEFSETPNINSVELIKLIQLKSTRYKLEGPTKLRFNLDNPAHEERIKDINNLLVQLSN
ncbi:MAG: transcription-repair coupling factor [Legionellaceae bacterium]|nr:transcription-repair coupling factor [Legionellaceae bacterium]